MQSEGDGECRHRVRETVTERERDKTGYERQIIYIFLAWDFTSGQMYWYHHKSVKKPDRANFPHFKIHSRHFSEYYQQEFFLLIMNPFYLIFINNWVVKIAIKSQLKNKMKMNTGQN